jgi:hypothetical protein
MATTVTAPVANNIALASKYLPILDEIYKAGSKTAILDTLAEQIRFDGAKIAYLYGADPVGLSAYSRNAGFVPGDVDGAWQPYEITQDRGRSFMVDVMDNDETLGMAFGTLLGEFERTEVIPEIDAYRFAKYAAAATGTNKVTETLSAAAATITSIDNATAVLDDKEVPYEGRILFVTPNTYKLIKGGVTRMIMNGDANVDYNVEMYNDMRVITVPSGRFHTAVTINAPTTSDGVGGFTAGGQVMNYMIVHPSAVMQLVKHNIPRIFSPEVNQEADAWKLNYRIYHDAWVKTNKVNGIFVSAPSAT